MKTFNWLFSIGLLFGAIFTAKSQDTRERFYYYEILEPRHEPKPKVNGFATEKIKENLNRGLTAVLAENGKAVYLSWRLLDSDNAGVCFNVFRKSNNKTIKLNKKPISVTCDFVDTKPLANASYWVEPVLKSKSKIKINEDEKVKVILNELKNYTSIKINDEERVGKIGTGDLNGDGKPDFVVRTPSSNVDPGTAPDTTGITFKISAYLHDGTFLWTHDLGLGIEPGIWYSPYLVFDLNGDGKAEVALKTAGNDYVRNYRGRIAGGSEFLTVLDGMTGMVISQVPWPKRNFRYGDVNRQNRNQIGIAYLDGKTPSLLALRGTYKLMVVDAWQLNGNKLEKLWHWDGDEENPIVRSMGAHNMVAADVDGDGRDEILLGSCMLDDDGTLLWSSGLGHSDKAYLTKLHPDNEGMQVFLAIEPYRTDGRGVCVLDAKTGVQIWGINQPTYHVGDGMVTDFDPKSPGLECFASEDRKGGSTDKYLFDSKGKKLNTTDDEVPGARNWVWWDGDLLRETFKGDDNRWGAGSTGFSQTIWKWNDKDLTDEILGNILMIVDLDGDWREEVITALRGEIRIYRTNIPAKDRRTTLLQDPVYRSYITHRSMGYPQSPVPSFYLGE